MQRILSGIRPTGRIHIGNYLGAIKQWVDLSQEQSNDCFFMVADYHALLSFRQTPLDQASYDLLAWELAAGLNPEAVTLFIQSQISQHTELAWILNSIVSVGELGRMTQYKDLVAQGLEQPSSALLTYPVLQAADILLYKATLVPVGEDQVQHVELTRTIAKRMNNLSQLSIFPVPNARLTTSARIMSLHDPEKKMSKSMPQGALLLEDDERTLRSKISRAVTDAGLEELPMPEGLASTEILSPSERALLFEHMSPGVRNLFIILEETSDDQNLINALLENYKSKTLQYRDLKAAVADAVIAFILPLQERYRSSRADESELENIFKTGAQKARQVAAQTLGEVKQSLHFAIE